MARFDLMDFEWSVIQPLLPNKPRVVPRVDDRRVLNGIFWRLRTGLRGRTSPIVRGAADDQNPRPGRRQRAADRLKLTEGQAHDGRSAQAMLDTIRRATSWLTRLMCTSSPCTRRRRSGRRAPDWIPGHN